MALFQNIFSFNNKGDITQTDVITVLTKTDTLVRAISRTFNDGHISQSLSDIASALKDHELDHQGKYKLLLCEAKFLINLGKFEECEERIVYLEDEYSQYVDLELHQLSLPLLALKKQRKEFDRRLNIIKQESKNPIMPDEYFEILYLVNSGDFRSAKNSFDKLDLDAFEKSEQPNFFYLGAILYSSLFQREVLIKDYLKSKKLFQDYLDHAQFVSYFQKLEASLHSNLYTLMHPFQRDVTVDEQYSIDSVIELIEQTYNDFNLLDKSFKNRLLSHYLCCLHKTREYEKAKLVYENNNGDEDLDNLCFYIRHFKTVTESEIQHGKIQSRILNDEKNNPLIGERYLISFPNQALNLFNENTDLLKNNTELLQIYIICAYGEKQKPSMVVVNYIRENKEASDLNFVLFLYSQQITNNNLSQSELDDFQKIVESSDDINIIFLSLKLLSDNNLFNIYVNLAVQHKTNLGITQTALELIKDDKHFSLPVFDNFIDSQEKLSSPLIVAEIYAQHKQLKKAYTILKKEWGNENSNQIIKIDIARFSLYHLSLQYYSLSKLRNEIDKEQNKIYSDYLKEHLDLLDINTTLMLGLYLLVTESSPNQGILYINRILLQTSKENLLNEDNKVLLKSVWGAFLQQFNSKFPIELSNNIYLEKAGVNYLKNEKNQDVLPEHSFSILNENEFDIAVHDDSYNKLSIFHKVFNGVFEDVFSMGTDMLYIKGDTPDELVTNLIEKLRENKEKAEDLLELHMAGEVVGFYNICNADYKNYFAIIPEMLLCEGLSLPSNQCRRIVMERKKLLTLSSIIFLKHLNKLDEILERADIYIQQTTIDFLYEELDQLKLKQRKGTLYSDGDAIFFDKQTKKKKKNSNKFLAELATKLISNKDRIIDDREDILINSKSTDIAGKIGFQEFKALAFSMNNNYQIISEDHIFDDLTKAGGMNAYNVSNAMSLIFEDDFDELIKIWEKLYEQGYKYVLDKNNFDNILNNLVFNEPYLAKFINLIPSIPFFLKIGNEYNWLKPAEDYYDREFKFIAPMKCVPERNHISRNIEAIMEVVKNST